jgi:1,4-alpha-glucan branching enzyme
MVSGPDFRVSHVTSVVTDHPGGYHEYFGESVDIEAMVYLMLVSAILSRLR